MKNYTVRFYKTQDFAYWNAFVSNAKNATFLFHRGFMEYHSDRFTDFSLVVLDDEKWVAVLPANVVEDVLYSHQGLTYGSLVFDHKMKLAVVLAIWKSILQFLNENEIKKMQIKMMPPIYFDIPSDELSYALFITEARLIRRDSLSVIDLSKPYSISRIRKQCAQKGKKMGLEIKEETNFKIFWEEILIPNLANKHQAKPVHSLEEIEKLHCSFPENIRHFNVYHNNRIVAGTTVFVSKNVAHPQYVSGQSEKNELGSLDYLYHHLITNIFKDIRFFDFGISNENQGREINEGLLFWKESFGARTVTQDFYEVETTNFTKLESVLI